MAVGDITLPLGGGGPIDMPSELKDSVKVSYLTSSQHNGAVLHFFQTVEAVAQRIDNVHRQKRTFAIVDLHDYSSDIHLGVTRCVMVSKIEEVSLPREEMRSLLGPFTEFDVLCQGSSMLDFIRTIGALYSPNAPGNKMILLQLKEAQQQQQRSVKCTVYTGSVGSMGSMGHLHRQVAEPAHVIHPQQPLPPPPPVVDHVSQQSHLLRSASPDMMREADVNEELRTRIRELEGEVQSRMKGAEMSEVVLKNEITGLKQEMSRLTTNMSTGVGRGTALTAVSSVGAPLGAGSTSGSGMWNDMSEPKPPAGPPPMWLTPVTQAEEQPAVAAKPEAAYPERSIYNTSLQKGPPQASSPYSLGSSVPRNPPPRSVTRPPPTPQNQNQSPGIWGF